ncbi:UNVERIFIED_CONTAM: hypothetical protein PYX00_006069 [Menopon gallinae]|uniref:Chitin-binding type-2 domain-containing protein n=1 Tax=Menopon gallinae TaxID=328185 RepID=A0AAW2HU60_9NEOP
MSFKAAVFAFLALSLVAVNGRPQNGLFDCAEKVDGAYPDPTDPKGYYVCVEGESVARRECEQGEIFDESIGNCVRENEEDEEKELESFDEDFFNREISEILKNERELAPPEEEPQQRRNSTYKVYNVQLTENVFPKSIVIIGKANREQKNK